MEIYVKGQKVKGVGTWEISNLTDSDKLRLLADWFDMKYPDNENAEVQKDLRKIADNIEKMHEELDYFKTWRYF